MSAINNVLSAAALAAGYFGISVISLNDALPRPALGPVLTVQHLTAERDGDTAVFDYARTIHRIGEMTYSVRIMARTADGVRQTCAMSIGPIRYSPESRLPDRIDLAWWTNGDCLTLPPGPAEIWTTWAPEDGSTDPLTIITEVTG